MDFYFAKGTIPLQLFWNSKAIYYMCFYSKKVKLNNDNSSIYQIYRIIKEICSL